MNMEEIAEKVSKAIKPKELKGTVIITRTYESVIDASVFVTEDKLNGVDEDVLDDLFWNNSTTIKETVKINLDY